MLRKVIYLLLIVFTVVSLSVYVSFSGDMKKAYARVTGHSRVIKSPYGDIEYAEGGSGPAVLVIHGSGGGYDQGELLAQELLGNQFHWIAPSRFGYLRSDCPTAASFDDQADAYACLLDQLHIEKVAVVAISHGGPSALLFAALYPDRVSSLTLISAGVASAGSDEQQQADLQGKMLMNIYKYDLLYWSLTKFFKGIFMEIMGASDEVISGLTPGQLAGAEKLIDYMNPVSLRSAGAAFDNGARMPNERIRGVQVPTLIFHARDDTLQLYRNAEYAKDNIAGARLVSYDQGGHLLVFTKEESIGKGLRQFITGHSGQK